MTATTRMTECSVSAATLYLACELGSTKWTLGFTPAPAQRPRVRTIAAGDLRALEQELSAAKARFGLALETPVRSCYEAGRDGFWLHRWLLDQGANINAIPGGFDYAGTGLHYAAFNGRRAMVEFLLERGADASIKDAKVGQTPAGWADHASHTEIRDLLQAR